MQLKKVISKLSTIMLSLFVMSSLIPANVFAVEPASVPASILTGTNCSFQNETLTVTGDSFKLPDGVSKSDVSSVIIEGSTTQITNDDFIDFTSLIKVTVKLNAPPNLGVDSFKNATDKLQIYVPAGKVDVYKAAEGWSAYADNIVEIVEAESEEAVNDETSSYFKAESASISDDTWANHTASDFISGEGSAANPYKIANAEQLALLASNVNNGNNYANKHFQLENNIDLSAYRWNPIGTYKWETDGNTINHAFSGSLDGNGKTISGLMVDERTDKGCAGLFGYISGNAINGIELYVKNLTISNASIYSSESGLNEAYSGILAGKAMVNDGDRISVNDVVVSGTITNEMTGGSYHSGGMIGEATRVDFTDCNADGLNISGATNTGGFVGSDYDSSFTNCKAIGSISGGWSLGGFVGYSASSSNVDPSVSMYTRCTADVDVTGTNWQLGGFVGFLDGGKITNSVAYGDVTSSVTDFQPKAGGFAGESSGTIEHSYAEGTVSSAHQTIMPGGFIGYDAGGTTSQCMFDKTINSALSAIGAVGTAGTNDVKEGTTQENKAGICADILDGHTIDTSVWGSDTAEHWHICSDCGEKFDIASHTLSDWIIDQEATDTTNGHKYIECTICQKLLQEENIPATGSNIKETAPPTTNTTSSPQTGDTANSMLYLTLLLLSGCAASIFIYKKKKNIK